MNCGPEKMGSMLYKDEKMIKIVRLEVLSHTTGIKVSKLGMALLRPKHEAVGRALDPF